MTMLLHFMFHLKNLPAAAYDLLYDILFYATPSEREKKSQLGKAEEDDNETENEIPW